MKKARELKKFAGGVVSMPEKSAFVGQHDGDGWLRIVHVERAASGDEFDEPGASVVVADIERNGHAVNARPAAGKNFTSN
jgi:hypothetical protein